MSEFINREDAIEAMTTARDTHCISTSDGEDFISYDMAQNFLRELPYSTALDKLFEALNKAYTCPSNLLDKAEALNDIMLAYKHFRDTNISEESYKNIKEQVDKRDYPDMQIGRAIADGVLIPECHGGRLLIVSEKYVKEHMIGLDAFQQKFIGEVDLSIAIVGVIDSIDGD